MKIQEYAMKNFIVLDNDTDEKALLKRFYLNNHRISNEIYAEDVRKVKDKIFDDKYNRLHKIKSLEQLKLQIEAVEKLLN